MFGVFCKPYLPPTPHKRLRLFEHKIFPIVHDFRHSVLILLPCFKILENTWNCYLDSIDRPLLKVLRLPPVSIPSWVLSFLMLRDVTKMVCKLLPQYRMAPSVKQCPPLWSYTLRCYKCLLRSMCQGFHDRHERNFMPL